MKNWSLGLCWVSWPNNYRPGKLELSVELIWMKLIFGKVHMGLIVRKNADFNLKLTLLLQETCVVYTINRTCKTGSPTVSVYIRWRQIDWTMCEARVWVRWSWPELARCSYHVYKQLLSYLHWGCRLCFSCSGKTNESANFHRKN